MPDDKPSIPSIKLMALVKHKTQNIKVQKAKHKDKWNTYRVKDKTNKSTKKKVEKNKPTVIGLSGGQGTGKTTISTLIKIILEKYFKLKVFKISIDDFYKTRKDRIDLSKKIHPLLKTRGVPGTHDIDIMLNFFLKVKKNRIKNLRLPKFDKSIDDRCKKSQWTRIKKPPSIIIFEGCRFSSSSREDYIDSPLHDPKAPLIAEVLMYLQLDY